MDANQEFQVTLSEDLMKRLRKEAQSQHVPIRWLVAGIICDTMDSKKSPLETNRGAFAGH
jgi:hypothetical protein